MQLIVVLWDEFMFDIQVKYSDGNPMPCDPLK